MSDGPTNQLSQGKTAIILAGGLGTRLRSVVSDVPKTLAPIAGRPFLAWLLELLSKSGFSRVVLAIGYKGDMIQKAFGGTYKGISLTYSMEEKPLGTGGALARALGQVQTDYVFVINGDTWITLDYQCFLRFAESESADLAIALANVDDVGRYGAVAVDDRDNIVGLSEKGGSGAGWINGGVYLMRKSVAHHFPRTEQFSFESAVLPYLIREISVKGFCETASFIDIGVPEDFSRAQTVIVKALSK